MSDSPILNEGLEANQIVSPDNLHTEPAFSRPVYKEEVQEEVVEEVVEKPKKTSKK
jgi:hypothetical protein